MDFGGVDKRRTKKDLKRKRLFRKYKRGGRFRTQNISPENSKEKKKGKKK